MSLSPMLWLPLLPAPLASLASDAERGRHV